MSARPTQISFDPSGVTVRSTILEGHRVRDDVTLPARSCEEPGVSNRCIANATYTGRTQKKIFESMAPETKPRPSGSHANAPIA